MTAPALQQAADEPVERDYGIGELAGLCQVTPRTIRFYEDQGLLAPRRVGTMRIFSHRDRARLQLILRGKRLGFSLAGIRQWLDLYQEGDGQLRQLQLLLASSRQRIDELEQQLTDLQVTLAELREIEAVVVAQLAAKGAAEGQASPGSP